MKPLGSFFIFLFLFFFLFLSSPTLPGFDTICVREPTQPHDVAGIRDFIARDTAPFCLVVALVEPHVPWVMGDASRHPPKKLKLPPHLADTPKTREHFANSLAEIGWMDRQLGDILAALEASGKEDDTLVLFTSEQGSQFPGCKWTNWDTGLRTAPIAAWPDRIAEGKRTGALVQYADVAPTLLDLALEPAPAAEPARLPPAFDGTSLKKVLFGKSDTHRQFAYGIHNNLPEGPPYPIRSVTDGRFRYIRNLLPGEIYVERHLMGGGRLNNPYWATWMGADPLKNRQAYELVKRYLWRPAEPLYLTSEDPYEMNNLAEDQGYSEIKEKLADELDRWMTRQGDPGAVVDTAKALQAARRGQHLHGPGR